MAEFSVPHVGHCDLLFKEAITGINSLVMCHIHCTVSCKNFKPDMRRPNSVAKCIVSK